MTQRLHINWGACPDWPGVRAKLRPQLKVRLYGNFTDLVGDPDAVQGQLEALGFQVSREPYPGAVLLRLTP